MDKKVGEGGTLRGYCEPCDYVTYRKTTLGVELCPCCGKSMEWTWGKLKVYWEAEDGSFRVIPGNGTEH